MPSERLQGATDVEAPHDLDTELWRRLDFELPADVFAAIWLGLQFRHLDHARSAVVVLRDRETGSFRPHATAPEQGPVDEQLAEVAELALSEREGQVVRPGADATLIAYPLVLDDMLHGVVAVKFAGVANPTVARNQLQWGMVWLRAYLEREHLDQADRTNERLISVLDHLAVVLSHETLESAALACVTELAGLLDADRVALGYRNLRGNMRVAAISQAANLVDKMNLTRAMAAAMDEALDQRETVQWPAEEGPHRTDRAHRELAAMAPSGAIVTAPIFCAGRDWGAIVVETAPGSSVDPATVEQIKSIALALGPSLEALRKNDESLLGTLGRSLHRQLARAFGPGHLRWKVTSSLIALSAAALAFVDIDHRIAADSRLEGEVQRTIAAPLDAYLVDAPVRAGDVVREGQLMSLLDDRDLRLQHLEVETQKSQLAGQLQLATAERDRAQAQIVGAQIEQADARLAALAEQLRRTRVTAPFDGIVIEGDLSQGLGSHVNRGDSLFVIAPLDAYRVVLEVDEADMRYIEVGQAGDLVLTSLPDMQLPVEVTKVTAISRAEEGVNRFRVEARLLEVNADVRPGMSGVSKVMVGRRPAGWVWGHRVYEWLSLQIWRWTP